MKSLLVNLPLALLACAHAATPPAVAPALPPGIVEGVVLDARGAAVADAIVAFVRPGAERPEATTRSDERGRFRFYERARGPFSVTATSSGGAAAYLPAQVLAADASRGGLRLALGPGGFTVRGVVKDRTGRPFPLARVHAARIGPEAGDLFATFADAAGRYELRLTEATHLLLAEADGHASRNPARAVPGGPETLDLVLDSARR
ncbi:MAG: carboxypeptidase-like regulatory domain-containing protein [Anaeromyxobacteraceae bacterium]